MLGTSRLLVLVAFSLLVGLVGPACAGPRTDLTTHRLRLQLPGDTACRPPAAVTLLEVRALGDFPPGDNLVEAFELGGAAVTIDRFPYDAELLALSASASGFLAWRAGAVHRIRPGDLDLALRIMPFERSCSLSDPMVFAPVGAAVAPMPYGGLLVAGGLEPGSGQPLRRLVRMFGHGGLSEVLADGLQAIRVGASATASGDRIVIAGGSIDAAGSAQDTFEILDATSGRLLAFAGRLCPTAAPAGCTGRRDQGHAVLPDGRVILVGGVAQVGGAPLETAMTIDARTGRVAHDLGLLPEGRTESQLLVLDDGFLRVVGGLGPGGRPASTALALTAGGVFVPVSGTPWPARAGAVAVGLPGARVVWVGGSTTVNVMLFDGVASVRERIDYTPPWPLLTEVRAVALRSGLVLVIGRGPSGVPRAFEFDPGRGTARELDATRVPRHLLMLTDGVVAEVDHVGASLRRLDLRTSLDQPPATLTAHDSDWVALDAAEHFDLSSAGATARVDAALHVPTLRFARLRVALAIDGPVTLVLHGSDGDALIALSSNEAGLGSCRLPLVATDAVSVERDGETVMLVAQSGSRACPAPGLGGRVGLSVEIPAGSTLESLQIARR